MRQRRHHQRGIRSVVPGVRSARWLVTTKPIWPWVSTAALERPVVPEVKKNQQGSSCSTATFSTLGRHATRSHRATDVSPKRALPIRQVKSSAPCRFTAAACSGKSPWHRNAFAPEAVREIGHLVRHQAEIGGHPDRAEPERGEHRPEHLVAILGMHEDAVALGDAARGERRRQRRDLRIDLAPGPGSVAPDETGAIAMPPRILGQHVRRDSSPGGTCAAAASGFLFDGGRHASRPLIAAHLSPSTAA